MPVSRRTEAEVAVRATLQTLEERISEGAIKNFIAQLPQGIGEYRDASDIDRRRTGLTANFRLRRSRDICTRAYKVFLPGGESFVQRVRPLNGPSAAHG